MADETVLVTGGSGFIGVHCISHLLNAGYRVRTTVRSLARESEVRAMLEVAGAAAPRDALSFIAADLESDAGWPAAAAGCAFVLHVASPFPARAPKHEDELIVPARDGTLRVLRAARDAGVRRLVLTSSFAAIGYGHAIRDQPYTEADWTDPNSPRLGTYAKSKTLAERAAWEFIAREGGALELAVVNPVAVFGPVLGSDYSTSIQLVRLMLDGRMPRSPRLSFGIVDARDVADLHLRAMRHPAAKGQRFLAVAGESMTIHEMALLLRARMGRAAVRAPTKEMPDWIVRLASLFSPALAQVVPELGKTKRISGEKARNLLGWTPRSNADALVATAESLARLGLLRRSTKAGSAGAAPV
ncbi:MAG TPA: aldehyde reductase [Steroidobacteraceae bacterium]|nr:aldehyde reductase [Steroidobacteraceae bacterium]